MEDARKGERHGSRQEQEREGESNACIFEVKFKRETNSLESDDITWFPYLIIH